ncbi:MAG: hypothetical protein COB46_00580 [Rhodospirillaceae bacterium]|nr:MAG: hypothetical protein COB46_00580 [Rhodospirillaceae bacterium]
MRFSKLAKRTKEFRSLRAAAPAIRKLVEETSRLDNPELLLCVGRFSKNIDKVLELTNSCDCHVKIRAILGPEVRELVLETLSKNTNFEILDVVTHPTGHIPNYLVSECGAYLQNGLEFEDAIVSFERNDLIKFLRNLYDDAYGEAA